MRARKQQPKQAAPLDLDAILAQIETETRFQHVQLDASPRIPFPEHVPHRAGPDGAVFDSRTGRAAYFDARGLSAKEPVQIEREPIRFPSSWTALLSRIQTESLNRPDSLVQYRDSDLWGQSPLFPRHFRTGALLWS